MADSQEGNNTTTGYVQSNYLKLEDCLIHSIRVRNDQFMTCGV